MMRLASKAKCFLAVWLIVMLATTGTALAEKPSGEKNGKHGQQDKHVGKGVVENGHTEVRHGESMTGHAYFSAQQREVVQKYYADQYHAGKCPPGLAKKNNGCMPPGQAKKWQIGHALPRDVVFYDLPQTVTVQLGIPPAGHRFIRVASDILLIAVGTGMVVDAIDDLGNL